jgi:hypothetical protein
MAIRPIDKIINDETMTDPDRFIEFVVSRAPGWDSDTAAREDIDWLEQWSAVEDQAPRFAAEEVGFDGGATYGEIARRMLDPSDPSAEW